jgi:hypothetical protein
MLDDEDNESREFCDRHCITSVFAILVFLGFIFWLLTRYY